MFSSVLHFRLPKIFMGEIFLKLKISFAEFHTFIKQEDKNYFVDLNWGCSCIKHIIAEECHQIFNKIRSGWTFLCCQIKAKYVKYLLKCWRIQVLSYQEDFDDYLFKAVHALWSNWMESERKIFDVIYLLQI